MSHSSPTSQKPAAEHGGVTKSDSRPFRYSGRLAGEIEARWQAYWDEHDSFRALNPGDGGFDPDCPKFYCLDMFPYPSGSGLHVGHPEGYTASDIVSRYKRMRGFNVLHPMGWDAFGLPAEQYAIQTGVHPAVTTAGAIETFRRQLKRFGFSYDWSRELATMDEDYYRWTQWIWLKAYGAWYDAEQDRARPIADLVAEFESGARPVHYDPDRPTGFDLGENAHEHLGAWADLDPRKRKHVLDTYRLAYLSTQTVNWCPKLGTALANEEVIDGRSERGGHPVLRKPLKQWMFRITAFAERLLADLGRLDWPDSTRTMQREWIGRSEGADIDFPLADPPAGAADTLRVYTTRPDTIFGATYMVIAPEHPLVERMLANPRAATDPARLGAYVEESRHRADVERMAESKEKTGVDTGFHAMNPATGARIPIWSADYVLMGYGHGAIMAVPAHDGRDFDFARTFDLPIVQVIAPPGEAASAEMPAAYTGPGRNVNSANDAISLDGRETAEAMNTINNWLEASGRGRRRVNFKLRDWLFSRQRYWGEPFPIVYDEHGDHYPVDPANLPVTLPEMTDYHPVESDEPMPLLGKADDWVHATAGAAGVAADVLPPSTPVTRETNTMPGWAGSCWYYLRFCDPKNGTRLVSREAERYWMLSNKRSASGEDLDDGGVHDPDVHHFGGVDLYIGGAEHAVLHLLYARFWHQLLFDLGEVSTPEPMGRLFHQGMITSYAYQRADRSLVPVDEVEEREEGAYVEQTTGEPVSQVVAKMSKSLRNVINPDDIIQEYGADTFRLYEMYMGPLEASKPWNTRDLIGLFRFLQRVWRLVVNEDTGALITRTEPDPDVERLLHRTIAKVGEDIERLAFNTAIAAMIEFVNEAYKADGLTPDQLGRFAQMLSPFAPHITEELWSKLGNDGCLSSAAWPEYDPALLQESIVELPVQVLGKVRGRITVPADADQKAVEAAALADERIAEFLAGKTVRKVIVVPGKIVNIIAG